MVVVKDRTAATCVNIIQKYVKRGSIIHSDMWKAYNPIEKMGMDYKHRKVCHKKEFVNTTDGFRTNTQMIEGTWGAQKKSIPIHKRSGEDLQECLFEFMWRRANAGDLWKALMDGLATVRFAIAETLRVDKVEEPWEPTDMLIRVEDCEDYDSAATEATETDNELEATVNATTVGTTQRRNNDDNDNNTIRRRQATQVPLVEAVPSAVFRERERQNELALEAHQEIVNGYLENDDEGTTDDNARGFL